jgi:hypothetical protein
MTNEELREEFANNWRYSEQWSEGDVERIIKIVDQVRQEERKRFEAMIPGEMSKYKEVDRGAWAYQEGFNGCRESLLSTLSKEELTK